VMIAASFWSLLAPAIEMAEEMGPCPWVPAVIGFLLGGGLPLGSTRSCPTCTWAWPASARPRASKPPGSAASCWCWPSPCTTSPRAWPWAWPSARWRRTCRRRHLAGAVALAIGIGIQNFPEGLAVSMPLRREGLSKTQELLVRAASGWWSRWPASSARGGAVAPDPALRPEFRRRRHDLRGGGGADPRVAAGEEHKPNLKAKECSRWGTLFLVSSGLATLEKSFQITRILIGHAQVRKVPVAQGDHLRSRIRFLQLLAQGLLPPADRCPLR
jgi:hypothetical protein